jgi:glycosyltransferase involved in cell wall biosynthesis
VDLAVQALSQLGRPLIVVGEGRDRANLERMAGPTVTFVGHLSDKEVSDLLRHCRAFIFPGLDDFGIAPVEAMASGRPVIAFAAGGALDTVLEGKTGLFFRESTSQALAATIQQFETLDFDRATIRHHAERFDQALFEAKLTTFVENAVESYGQLTIG